MACGTSDSFVWMHSMYRVTHKQNIHISKWSESTNVENEKKKEKHIWHSNRLGDESNLCCTSNVVRGATCSLARKMKSHRNICRPAEKCMLNIPGRSIAFWLINTAPTGVANMMWPPSKQWMSAHSSACNRQNRRLPAHVIRRIGLTASLQSVNACLDNRPMHATRSVYFRFGPFSSPDNIGDKLMNVLSDACVFSLNRVQSMPRRFEQVFIFSFFASPLFGCYFFASAACRNLITHLVKYVSALPAAYSDIQNSEYTKINNEHRNEWKSRVSFLFSHVLLMREQNSATFSLSSTATLFIKWVRPDKIVHLEIAAESSWSFGIEFCRSLLLIEFFSIFVIVAGQTNIVRMKCRTRDHYNPLQPVCVCVCSTLA